jgi:hypothetical protein
MLECDARRIGDIDQFRISAGVCLLWSRLLSACYFPQTLSGGGRCDATEPRAGEDQINQNEGARDCRTVNRPQRLAGFARPPAGFPSIHLSTQSTGLPDPQRAAVTVRDVGADTEPQTLLSEPWNHSDPHLRVDSGPAFAMIVRTCISRSCFRINDRRHSLPNPTMPASVNISTGTHP